MDLQREICLKSLFTEEGTGSGKNIFEGGFKFASFEARGR